MIQIAAKYSDATFVVENKAAAGGLIAWEYVLSQPAAGYNLLAVTRSNIANLISTKSKLQTLTEIIADTKARTGQQIWIVSPGDR